jgi:hypothetical protein
VASRPLLPIEAWYAKRASDPVFEPGRERLGHVDIDVGVDGLHIAEAAGVVWDRTMISMV